MLDGASDRTTSGIETEGDMIRRVGLRKILREDYKHHRGEWTWAGLQALWIHRIGVYGSTLKRPWRSLFAVFHGLGQLFCRNVYGIEIARSVQIGRRMMIAHQHGISIHKFARFGDDCLIRNNVAFGSGTSWVDNVGPVIGNGVEFEVGAVVLGNVTIGDNARIGPNTVVTTDIPANHSVSVATSHIVPRQED